MLGTKSNLASHLKAKIVILLKQQMKVIWTTSTWPNRRKKAWSILVYFTLASCPQARFSEVVINEKPTNRLF